MAQYCILDFPLPVCLAQVPSRRDLHVSSSSYLVAVVLINVCIQKKRTKILPNLTISICPEESQNIDRKNKMVVKGRNRKVLNRSEQNEHDGDQRREGEGP